MFRPCASQFQLDDNAHRRKVPCITMCPCGFDLLRDAFKKKNVIFSDIVIKCVSGSG